jgi:hypothetical protein
MTPVAYDRPMSQAPGRPELVFYSRSTCEPCDEARLTLGSALDQRAAEGQPVPTVREVDVDSGPELRARYGALVPVVVLGDSELSLTWSGRQLRAFLDANMPRVV